MQATTTSTFQFFPQLNDVRYRGWMKSRTGASPAIIHCFQGEGLPDRLALRLFEDNIIPMKEILECGEFFSRIRKDTRAECVADLCCGHGLLGILFAIFEKKVQRVLLVDKVTPPSRQPLLAWAREIAPWIEGKVHNINSPIRKTGNWLEPGCAITSAHACGRLSDQCIDFAIESGGPIGILPCCYPRNACRAPLTLQTALGLETAYDVDRTYRLQAAGYHVRWSTIPAEITPMNRVITGRQGKR